ncbi:MAG: DUF134 domain-containing protein [Firmicutes bacterium]|nr:DUF134 domain-containing protein [Bacillota bacterium]
MARPRKWRKVCALPAMNHFGPIGRARVGEDVVSMTVDEYEAIRLIDWEGFTQEECAEQMGISRTTVQGIYSGGRKKLADVLVHGKILSIEGGEFFLCEGEGRGCGPGCRRHRRGRR